MSLQTPSHPRPCVRFWNPIVLTALAFAVTSTHAASENVLESARPVAEAVAHLNRLGYAVTYEDPSYEYREDVRDITAELGRRITTGSHRSLVPVGGRVTLPVATLEPHNDIGARTFLTQLLHAETLDPHLGKFEVIEVDSMLHVVPTEVRDATGAWVPQKSVLEIEIEVPAGNRTALTMLNEVCSAVTRVIGEPLVVGTIPLNSLARSERPYSRSSGTARKILTETLSGFDTRFAWRIYYDPGLRMRALNVIPIKEPAEASDTNTDRAKQRPQTPSSARSVASPHGDSSKR